ncbi:MAG: hypothetical protein QW575_04440 [Thermoproteota archaeon]
MTTQKSAQADNETWKALLLFYLLIPLLVGLFGFIVGAFIYIKTGPWIAFIGETFLIIFLIVYLNRTGYFAHVADDNYEWNLLIFFSTGLSPWILISLYNIILKLVI